ncbi:MAG: hypothetical protein AB8G05_09080 [Oligoflexales bacterium]
MDHTLKVSRCLVVAHPDDEVIWFAPEYFNLIVIVFLGREDKPWMDPCRKKSLFEHDLGDKILCLNLIESGFWKDASRSKEHRSAYAKTQRELKAIFNRSSFNEIYTHGPEGEYGHSDHTLVHQVVKKVLRPDQMMYYPVSHTSRLFDLVHKSDTVLRKRIMQVYKMNKCWTWNEDHIFNEEIKYRAIK